MSLTNLNIEDYKNVFPNKPYEDPKIISIPNISYH